MRDWSIAPDSRFDHDAPIKYKHDKRFRLHAVKAIDHRGKSDSADVVCTCGYIETHAAWWQWDTELDDPHWTTWSGKPLKQGVVTMAVVAFCNALKPQFSIPAYSPPVDPKTGFVV